MKTFKEFFDHGKAEPEFEHDYGVQKIEPGYDDSLVNDMQMKNLGLTLPQDINMVGGQPVGPYISASANVKVVNGQPVIDFEELYLTYEKKDGQDGFIELTPEQKKYVESIAYSYYYNKLEAGEYNR